MSQYLSSVNEEKNNVKAIRTGRAYFFMAPETSNGTVDASTAIATPTTWVPRIFAIESVPYPVMDLDFCHLLSVQYG